MRFTLLAALLVALVMNLSCKKSSSDGGGKADSELPMAGETPLGEVTKVAIATGNQMVASWEKKPKPGRAFVLVDVTARKNYPSTNFAEWAILDSSGERHAVVAIMTRFGAVAGAGSMSVDGSASPQKNTIVFEAPANTVSRVILCVGDRKLGFLVKN